MKLTDLKIRSIDRIIAHTIYQKTQDLPAYAKCAAECLEFSEQEKGILIGRLYDALSNSKKTFKLSYEDKSEKSIYFLLHNNLPLTDKEFIRETKSLAEALADSHFRTRIPGGYCLVGEGYTFSDQHFFFIIKAELQEVFSIEGNTLQLVKDVFLSPAKDFYKIGFFIDGMSEYVPFMYDDQFSLQKKDLTEYFYGKFMGLTTDKNDSLKSKNFYEDAKTFIQDNIPNSKDQVGLIKALTTIYREDTSGILSPKKFSEDYLEGHLKDKFDKLVEEKYPHPFTKDVTLIDKRLNLQRISIPLSYSLSLVGDTESLEQVNIYDTSEQSIESIIPEINSGITRKVITINAKVNAEGGE